MSGMLASQVWKYKLDKTSLVVLMALCDIADDDGTSCYPRPRYLKWKTGSSLATCYRMLEKFTEKGVLEQVGWRGETAEYNIHLENLELKPAFERKRMGRPRKKSSHGEKTFAPREKNRTTRNVSQDEKSLLTVRNVSSPREKFSHGENEEHRLQVPQTEAGNGIASKRDVSESILLNQSYDPILEIQDASQKNAEEKTPEPEAPRTLQQEFTAWLARSEYSEVPGQRMTPIEKRQYEDRAYRRLSHQEVMTAFLASRQRQEVAV